MKTPRLRLILAYGLIAVVLATALVWRAKTSFPAPLAANRSATEASAAAKVTPPALGATLPTAQTSQRTAEEPQNRQSGQQQAFQALPKTEQESLWSAFASARRAVQPLTDHEASLPHNTGVRYFAQNPSQQLTARFLDGTARIESGRGGKWSATLGLAGAAKTKPVLTKERVEYHHANGITEWYENRAEGIEHAFTIAHRPSETSDQLRLVLALQGVEVRPGKGEQASTIIFADPASGVPVLSYGTLKVWDATGRELAARYEILAQGLEIVVADAGAVYPVTIDPMITTQEAKLGPDHAADGLPSDYFGSSVALFGDTALVGAVEDDSAAGSNSGSAYIFTLNSTVWSLQTKLTSSDAAPGDNFGNSVTLFEDTALVGAYFDNSAAGSDTGCAYVFTRSGTVWSQQAQLTAGDAADGDRFASSVTLSGNTVLVGACFDDTTAGVDAGSAYVFIRSGTVWSQQAHLNASDSAMGDQFGISAALDGDTAVMGAHSNGISGCAYVFTRSGTIWSEQAKLTASDAASEDFFGKSVAISGETALVGASYDDILADTNAGSAYVFTRSGTVWSQEAKLTASDTSAYNYFGCSVALLGDTALLGATVDFTAGDRPGYAYIFTRSGTLWTQQAKLNADNGRSGDHFGFSVALSEGTALVGARYDNTSAGIDAGSAYVFTRNGTSWSQQAQLSAGDTAVDDYLGYSVALSGDTALVGAHRDDTVVGVDVGSAYIFTRIGIVWSHQAQFIAGDADEYDRFGIAVALSGDTALVGSSNSLATVGSAYVFTRNGAAWSQQAQLSISNAATGDYYGSSVALSGNTAMVGAFGDNTPAGLDAGRVFVFTRSGTDWSQQAQLIANDASVEDLFGKSVALDGDTALVGAYHDDTEAGQNAGSAYIFIRNGTVWSQQAKLTASDAATEDFFGSSAALDGDVALVGAYAANVAKGSAYIFTRSGTVWSQQAKLAASDATDGDFFGDSVALSGSTALVGAPHANFLGSAYIFTPSGNAWHQQSKFTGNGISVNALFGSSVALSRDTALVGAPSDDTPTSVTGDFRPNNGGVYVFRLEFRPPEIALRGNGVDIINGDTTPSLEDDTDFGSTLVEFGSPSNNFTITNSGVGALMLAGTPRVRLIGSAAFSLTQQPTSSTVAANGGTQTFRITFDPASAGLHTATAIIENDDLDENLFEITISGIGLAPPIFTTQPASQLVLLGSQATFAITTSGFPESTYQWKKGTANIAGALGSSFTIPVTKAADAGAFSVIADNPVDAPVPSQTAYLGLVTLSQGTQVLKKGAALSLKCTVAAPVAPGVSVSYSWRRSGNVLSNGTQANLSVITGADKAALSITKIGTEDVGNYTCLVTLNTPGNDPQVANGDTVVQVVDAVPVLNPIPLPAIVSVSQPIDAWITASNFPTGFSLAGLPAGLKFDTKTGRLYGRPTVPSKKNAAGTAYIPNKLTFKATNPFNAGPALDFSLTIEALDPTIVGTFNGVVSREGYSNFGMGGYVQITVANTGVVSGSATLAGQKHSVVGALDISVGNDPTAELLIKRTPATLGDLELTINIVRGNDLMQGTITDPEFEIVSGGQDLGGPDTPGFLNGPVEDALFNGPRGIALLPNGDGYLADTGNHLIRKVADDTVTTFAGTAEAAGESNGTGTAASFESPEGLALDPLGNLYVADTGNATIRKITALGVVTAFAGTADQIGNTNATGAAARFNLPCALCFDPAGNLYVVDRGNHTIRKITPAGVVTTLAGKADTAGHKDGSGIAAIFNTPRGIVYEPVTKALFVTDSGNNVIRKVTLTGTVTPHAGSPGVEGYADGLLANARFIEPMGITTVGNGILIVGDKVLRQINPNGVVGAVTGYVDLNGLDQPVALAFSESDEVVLAVHDTLHGVSIHQPTGMGAEAVFDARRNPWTAASNVAQMGSYTAGIETSAVSGDLSLPQGDGYATLAISKTGVATWAGKAANGTGFTFGTVMAADLSIPLHVMMYKNTGSLQGECFINATTLDLVSDVIPAFDWYKIPQPLASTDRSYKGGFLVHPLELSGGKYAPNNIYTFLGLAGAPASLTMDFSEAGLTAFSEDFTIATPNTVNVPTNPSTATLKIDPKTGIYTGSFKTGSPAVTSNFTGVIIDYEAGNAKRGYGHFLLPSSTAATAPLTSGRVRLEK